jgi:hypothetical protein
MEEITIVRRRNRVVPILIALLVLAAIVLAVLYVIGTGGVMSIGSTIGVDTGAPGGAWSPSA